MERGILRIDPARQNVTIWGTAHPINFGEVLAPSSVYKIHTYAFQGERGQWADGCVFEIAPHGSTTVMRILDARVQMQEVAIKGRGWFLGITPDGELIESEAGEHLGDENPLVGQNKAYVGVWIAGKEGLDVLDVTEPPFDPSMEIEVKRNDPAIPPEFWKRYDALKANST